MDVILMIKKEVLGRLLAAVSRSARISCGVIFLSPRVGERETTRKVVVILKERRRRTASVHYQNRLTSETVHREPKQRKYCEGVDCVYVLLSLDI
jgi:hypothetical protein